MSVESSNKTAFGMPVDMPGVSSLVPYEEMTLGAKKLRDAYGRVPGASLYRKEFGYYGLEKWQRDGHLSTDADLSDLFMFDPPGSHILGQLGWCEAAMQPAFEEYVVEQRREHEVVQDYAGRHVLFFKGRRNGFMPTYLTHPVSDRRTWEENMLPRLDSSSPERYVDLDERMKKAQSEAGRGMMIEQNLIGGYMYLRALAGPEDTLLLFHDDPELIHSMMQTWFDLADAVIARHQEYVTLDELYLAEDICYNHGPLISPDMMRRFLFPYYEQLIANIRDRQIDKNRHLYIQIDTDGFADPVISVYREVGVDTMSPFEVAAGCDIVRAGAEYPDMALFGGIDKRILAEGRDAIDRELDRIIPTMRDRGGYVPTCDHGVPEEVGFDDYMHYRKRVVELGG
jgi:hypothetical protein